LPVSPFGHALLHVPSLPARFRSCCCRRLLLTLQRCVTAALALDKLQCSVPLLHASALRLCCFCGFALFQAKHPNICKCSTEYSPPAALSLPAALPAPCLHMAAAGHAACRWLAQQTAPGTHNTKKQQQQCQGKQHNCATMLCAAATAQPRQTGVNGCCCCCCDLPVHAYCTVACPSGLLRCGTLTTCHKRSAATAQLYCAYAGTLQQ
jgi:hypothetical protein